MDERERVIYDLARCTCHVPDACRDCSKYGSGNVMKCMESLMMDALELLKEQEPRVMTLEETKAFGWDYCYLEELRLPGKEYRAVCGDYALTCITWPCTTSMRIQRGDGNYNKTWRCWTEKPTEEQRKAAKWDG